MTLIAPTLQAFFTDRLTRQLNASPRTIASYRDSLRLLLCFANDRTGIAPSALDWDDLDEPLIAAFLEHLPRLRVRRVVVVGAEEGVHELCRPASYADGRSLAAPAAP